MITCHRCNRRLRGFVSQRFRMGPVCLRKSHQEAEEAEKQRIASLQSDLFPQEITVASMSNRMRKLLDRIQAMHERSNDAHASPPVDAAGNAADA